MSAFLFVNGSHHEHGCIFTALNEGSRQPEIFRIGEPGALQAGRAAGVSEPGRAGEYLTISFLR